SQLHARIVDDVGEVLDGPEIAEANLSIGWVPAVEPPVQPVFGAVARRVDKQRGSDGEDVVLQATELSGSVDNAKRRWSRTLEARTIVEIGDLFCLENHIVSWIGGGTLHADQDLPGRGAADADVQPPGTYHGKVTGRKVRTLATYEALERLQARDDRLRCYSVH